MNQVKKKFSKMEENIINFEFDKIAVREKTSEQIKRNYLDPTLETRPLDKAVYLLQNGDNIQKLSVLNSFTELMENYPEATLTRVLPKIEQELTHANAHFHQTTSQIFQILIESHFKADGNITATIVRGIESRDTSVGSAWLHTLLEVITYLPLHVIQTEVLPFAIRKGQCSQSTTFRIFSCKIFGKIVLHSDIKPLHIQKDILPSVYSLCQDVSGLVRAAICEQIPAISRGLGSNLVKNYLLPNLVELSSDTDSNVSAAAVSSVVQILPYLDEDTKCNTMVPLVTNLFHYSLKLDNVMLVISKNIGLLFKSLEKCLTSDKAKQFVHFYMQLSVRPVASDEDSSLSIDPLQIKENREHCASNFPAALSFTMKLVPNQLADLYDVFKAFIFDSDKAIRYSIAAVFHQVVELLGAKNSLTKAEFIKLLEDEETYVLQMLVPHISTILLLYVDTGTLSLQRTDPFSEDIGRALQKCLIQLQSEYNWRLLANFLKQLEYLPMVFRSEHINNEFTPVLMECALDGRTKPVRSQAVRTLLVFLRWNTKVTQKTDLRKRLVSELAGNRSSYTRHVFIQLCAHAMDLFSHKFFKANFFIPLIQLANDRVSTVRYCTVSLLPRLQTMITLPEDHRLFQSLNDAILQLERNEKDRDVLENLATVSKESRKMTFRANHIIMNDREKQLVQEEQNIVKGKATFKFIAQDVKPRQAPARVSRRNQIGYGSLAQRSGVSKEASPRSRTAQSTVATVTRATAAAKHMTSARDIISDMTFLKQHFYIDAGVDLPIEEETVRPDMMEPATVGNASTIEPHNKSVPNDLPIDISHLTLADADYAIDHSSTVNMTDDVKVNMRRKHLDKGARFSNSEIPTIRSGHTGKIKRHSSVYSETATASATTKRRSLNIQPKELSKIPVFLKQADSDTKAKTRLTAGPDKRADVKNTVSGLPVFVRRK